LGKFDMALGIKVAVNVTALAVFCNDAIPFICLQVSLQGIIEGFGMAGREAQECTQSAKNNPVLHNNASCHGSL
jgi:hypothetical protein